MSKTVEEVRRAAFEKWWVECENRKKPETFNSGDYCAPSAYNAWKAFNAALDAVDIELPSDASIHPVDSPHAVLHECRAAIEQTGLGIRVK